MIESTSDLWWKNAVVYCLDVESFMDWTGDGCGDFRGLIERIDYLAGLGITCLWLLPFYRSPRRDAGYDVSDHYSVHQSYGSLGDLTEFLRTAGDRGIRVMVDLTANHTSDQHPWFRAARADRDSPFRDFYVWRDEPPERYRGGPAFPGEEDGLWHFDEQAGQYYLHRFYRHEPDLNIANEEVRREIGKVIGFWLRLGVSGFRVDAVPHLIEVPGSPGQGGGAHDYLRSLRSFVGRRGGEAMLLGEANLPPDEQKRFFGSEDGDELHMIFNFQLNQALYLALARADAGPIRKALAALGGIPVDCQWANFVRNHDELTLDQLTVAERQEVFDAFSPGEDAEIYDRGLRCRLPTLLGDDELCLRLVYSLVFSLPGTPVLLYGEEIGMGDNPDLPGRISVRAPMQWTGGTGGGFSQVDASRFSRAPVHDERFCPDAVNVTEQRRDPESMLNWMERLIRRRKECPEIGWGDCEVLDADHHSVLAHRCDWDDRSVLLVHNLSGSPARARVPLRDADDVVEVADVFGEATERIEARPRIDLDLDAFGFRWLRLRHPGQRPLQ